MLHAVRAEPSGTVASASERACSATGASLAGAMDGWALPAILVVAALNFFWQLGSSSYYVDEALSVQHSIPPLSSVLPIVRMTETTPWTYFVFLHEWIGRTWSQAESVTRLPSAIAGVALVAAVYWMARAFLDRRPALLAGALCALSPLVLDYAQQVRGYVFAMLAVTIAVGATVRAASAPASRTRLLAVGAVAAVLSLWLHYTAALVILPLCAWLATRASVPSRSRAAFIGVCLLAGLAELPLFIDQYNSAPNGGLVGIAGITWTNVVSIAETPFDSRASSGAGLLQLLGTGTVVGSALVLTLRRSGAVRNGPLLAALGLVAPLGLLVLGIAGKYVVITRYSAVAAPFLLTALAAATAALPRAAAIILLAATLVVSVVGVADSHRRTGFYPPSREAITYIRADQRSGDTVITPGLPGTDIQLDYYGNLLLHPLPQLIAATNAGQVSAALATRPRAWLIRILPNDRVVHPVLLRVATALLRGSGYRAVSVRTFTTGLTFAVILAVPSRR